MIVTVPNVREAARWLICGALVLGAHGTIAAVIATWSDPVPPGEAAAAIMIELAPMETAPSTEKTDAPIGPQETQNQPEPTREPIEEKEPEKEPEPQVAEQPPIPDVAPTPPQKDVAVELPPEKPKPKPKPQPKKMALATAPAAAERLNQRAAAPMPGIAATNPNAMASWKGLVAAHLQRHKRYPAGAQSRREEGTVSLAFTLDRHGRVVVSRISHSSGYMDLDQETLALVQRAQPFPDPPPDIAGQHFSFVVPLRYNLR